MKAEPVRLCARDPRVQWRERVPGALHPPAVLPGRFCSAVFSRCQVLQKAKPRLTLCVPWLAWVRWRGGPALLLLLPAAPPLPPAAQVAVLSQGPPVPPCGVARNFFPFLECGSQFLLILPNLPQQPGTEHESFSPRVLACWTKTSTICILPL